MARPDLQTPADRDALRTVFRQTTGTYGDRAALLAETAPLPENLVLTELQTGGRYVVAASGASDHHLTDAGGNKLYVLPGHGGEISVTDFGAVGDGVTDDTAALQAAITVATTEAKKLVFPRADYIFSDPLTISGVDVDFQKSILRYAGDPGSFALTLNSNAGASLNQRNGNRYTDLTLLQEDFSEYTTYSNSVTYDPPNLPAFDSVTEISPTYTTTTVPVVGARAGGYVRVTFDQLADGCTMCGAVTSDDEVTVYLNSYIPSDVNMASGTLTVEVVNNAYHGLCIGGGQGELSNFKIQGFTGVSIGVGGGICQITGVTFPASSQAYYWNFDANVAAAAGWGFVCQPRNNENAFSLGFFGYDAYGDATPKRAPYINCVVMSGLNNTLGKLSLEAAASEGALILTDAAKTIFTTSPIYYEANPVFESPPDPIVVAKNQSCMCSIQLRAIGRTVGAIQDDGYANQINIIPGSPLNGGAVLAPRGGENLLVNGDFENGSNNWTLWGTGSLSIVSDGGLLTGNAARVDMTAEAGNLQQNLDDGFLHMAGLSGRTATAGAWVRTNVTGVYVSFSGQRGQAVPGDENWYYATSVARLNAGENAVQIRVATGSGKTGYFEVSGVSATLGTDPVPILRRTDPTGSKTYNLPSLADGSRDSTTVTVPGAELGDIVGGLSMTVDLQGIQMWGYVSAADTVTVVFENNTGGVLDLASGTLRALVKKV